MSASQVLIAAASDPLRTIAGLTGVHEAMPLQAALPYATIEAGLENDWGHKSGAGRELRLSLVLRDGGERPDRLRALGTAAQAAIEAVDPALAGWRLVTLVLVRAMTVAEGPGRWILTLDYRARMLAD